jgi:hypothetical protein
MSEHHWLAGLLLGEPMGMPARRTHSEAFRVVANNPGVARVAQPIDAE